MNPYRLDAMDRLWRETDDRRFKRNGTSGEFHQNVVDIGNIGIDLLSIGVAAVLSIAHDVRKLATSSADYPEPKE